MPLSSNKHFKSFFLNKQDMCDLLDISMSSLDRRIKDKEDLPKYKKKGTSKTAPIQFHIVDVAQYLFDNERGTYLKFD